ncbi:hypothetical protein Dcar01_02804 [Deinococcus carri]|uniref:Uncharacterized protein n=1 Tax=Deinococcus carri TaxID=1211323 RepID=A0ABP9WC67_9DEIO
MTNLDQFLTPDALATHLEQCDAAYSRWDNAGKDPLPADDELRAALERVHGLPDHPRASEIWDEAYQRGHSDGVGRIGSEYGDIVRWVSPTVLALPPLAPIFERLAAVHPWWTMRSRQPSFLSFVEWTVDGATLRDEDWMRGHLALLKQVNRTRMGLGWSHLHSHATGRQSPFTARTFTVSRGHLEEGVWVQRGISVATGPTDLHAYAEALTLACEAEVQERGQLVIIHPDYAEGWWN